MRRRLREAKGKYYTLREDIAAMSEVPVAFEPGTHFLYGFGHEMVAGLIEVCSGMTVWECNRPFGDAVPPGGGRLPRSSAGNDG